MPHKKEAQHGKEKNMEKLHKASGDTRHGVNIGREKKATVSLTGASLKPQFSPKPHLLFYAHYYLSLIHICS